MAFGSSSQKNVPFSLLGGPVPCSFSLFFICGLHQVSLGFTAWGLLCSYCKAGNGGSSDSWESVGFLLAASGWFQAFLMFLTWLKE